MDEHGYNEPTNFTESNALLALGADDEDHALDILRGMSPGELERLAHQARWLASLCWRARSEVLQQEIADVKEI